MCVYGATFSLSSYPSIECQRLYSITFPLTALSQLKTLGHMKMLSLQRQDEWKVLFFATSRYIHTCKRNKCVIIHAPRVKLMYTRVHLKWLTSFVCSLNWKCADELICCRRLLRWLYACSYCAPVAASAHHVSCCWRCCESVAASLLGVSSVLF